MHLLGPLYTEVSWHVTFATPPQCVTQAHETCHTEALHLGSRVAYTVPEPSWFGRHDGSVYIGALIKTSSRASTRYTKHRRHQTKQDRHKDKTNVNTRSRHKQTIR
jgi:hypothetical protein